MRCCELFRIDGCVEPCHVGGPYKGYPALLAAARQTRVESRSEDMLLYAWVDDAGRPVLSSFSTVELESGTGLG